MPTDHEPRVPRSSRHRHRRGGARLGVAAAVVLAVLAWAAPAFAHVGATAEATDTNLTQVTFSFQHGCNGSPTTGLRIQLPAGTTDVQPSPKDGWNYGVANGELNWSGGQVPDGQTAEFIATMVIPGQAGQTVFFPTIQSCVSGSEDWIDTGPDPESPTAAPRIDLVIDGPTTTTTEAPTTTTTAAPTTTTTVPTTTSTSTTTTSTTRVGTTIAPVPIESSSSPWPWIILVLVAVAGAAVIGVLLYQRAQNEKQNPPGSTGPGQPDAGPSGPPTAPPR